MKTLIIALLVVIAGNFGYAQDSNTMYLKTDTSARIAWKDYLVMKNGVMMFYKKDDSSVMTGEKTLKDGTVIKQDGTLTHKNGKQEKLGEGEGVYLDGTLLKRKPAIKHH